MSARHSPLIAGRVPLLPISAIVEIFADPSPLEALRRSDRTGSYGSGTHCESRRRISATRSTPGCAASRCEIGRPRCVRWRTSTVWHRRSTPFGMLRRNRNRRDGRGRPSFDRRSRAPNVHPARHGPDLRDGGCARNRRGTREDRVRYEAPPRSLAVTVFTSRTSR